MSIKLQINNFGSKDANVTGSGYCEREVTQEWMDKHGFNLAIENNGGGHSFLKPAIGGGRVGAWSFKPRKDKGSKGCILQCEFDSAELVDFNTDKDRSLVYDEFTNETERDQERSIALARSVQNTFTRGSSTTFTAGLSVTVGVEYGNELSAVKGKVETTASFETSLETNEERSKTVDLGVDQSLTATVPPGKTYALQQSAGFGYALFKVRYKFTFTGEAWIGQYHGKKRWTHHVVPVSKIWTNPANLVKYGYDDFSFGLFSNSSASIKDITV